MKKFLAIILTALIVMTAALPAFAAPKKGMLVLGDSLATGYGLPGYTSGRQNSAQDSFANKLAAKYKLSYGNTYYNFAIDGMTSGELAAALSQGKGSEVYKTNPLGANDAALAQYAVVDSSATQVAIKNCDTIVLSIGGNDLLRPMFEILMGYVQENAALLKMMGIDLSSMSGAGNAGLSSMIGGANSGAMMTALTKLLTSEDAQAKFAQGAKDYAANLTTILTSIYALNPKAEVYLVCLYNPFDGVEMFASMAELTNSFVDAMAASAVAVSKTLSSKGMSFTPVQLKQQFAGKAMMLTNILAIDIHPNVQGHDIIFSALSSAIDAPKTTASAPTVFAPSTFDAAALAAIASVVSLIAVKSAKKHR